MSSRESLPIGQKTMVGRNSSATNLRTNVVVADTLLPRADCAVPVRCRRQRIGIVYIQIMKTKKLTEVLERIEAWPPEAQNALADFALDLDAGFKAGDYEPTAEELAGIERGLRDAAEGRFATPQQVEAAFAKFRIEG